MSQLVPYELASVLEDNLMFATMFDYQIEEHNKPVLGRLEGLQSGVPTRTTATITPTQLRNLEQTYIELTSCHPANAHAGFVPPPLTPHTYGVVNSMGYGEAGSVHVSPGPASGSGGSGADSTHSEGPPRRRTGGRRPQRALDVSPEEEERRRVRRERNKMAAARCRKRRLDHTNELQDETDRLEEKKHALQEEIRKLNADRDQLQEILHKHLVQCALNKRPPPPSPPDVKPFQAAPAAGADAPVLVKLELDEQPPVDALLAVDPDLYPSPMPDDRVMLSAASAAPASRPRRPNYLQVPLTLPPAQMHNKALGANKIAGIEISTPSNGIPFNFDSLMEGGTGLTPVHPHPHPLPLAASHVRPPADSLVTL